MAWSLPKEDLGFGTVGRQSVIGFSYLTRVRFDTFAAPLGVLSVQVADLEYSKVEAAEEALLGRSCRCCR